MAYGGMLPNVWVPWGTQTLYDKGPKIDHGPDKRIMKFKGPYHKTQVPYNYQREQEEENLMLRKLKADLTVIQSYLKNFRLIKTFT